MMMRGEESARDCGSDVVKQQSTDEGLAIGRS